MKAKRRTSASTPGKWNASLLVRMPLSRVKYKSKECNDKRIRQEKGFIYLGSTVTSNSKCDEDINKRIALARALFTKMS